MRHILPSISRAIGSYLQGLHPIHRQALTPILIFMINIGAWAQPNEVQDILVTPTATFGQANTIHQSFTPTQDGRLVKFTIDLGGNTPAGNRTVNIYEGDGIAGTLLATFTHNLVGNTSVVSVTDVIELPVPIAVTAGSSYTWQVDNVNPRTLQNTSGNDYTGGSGFNTFNGTPFTNFDIGFSIILDIGTNVSIESPESVATTDPFTVDITFYGTPTNLEDTDFTAINGTVTGLSMVSTEVYELSVSPSGDGTVTLNMASGVALIDGLDNDAASATVEVDLPPFQNPDLILTTSKLVASGAQLFLNNAGINANVFFAPAGTTVFTTGTTITQGTTILMQDDPTCTPMPEVVCGTDPITGLPNPPGCVAMPEVICTSSNFPVIFAPTDPGEYKLFLTDGAGGIEAISSTTLFVTNETAATTAAITVDDNNVLAGETAEVTFVFLGAVTGFTNDDLTVSNGTLSTVASTDGNITFTATFTPSTDVVAAANVITLDNTGITDGATAGTGTTDSETFAIDTGIPKISSIQCTSGCNDVYDRFSTGQIIAMDVNFDREVTLTGTMELELAFELGNKVAIVTQQSGTQNFTASYTLNQSDLTTDLDYTITSALSLTTGSSIVSATNGLAADLTLATPGSVGSISENRDVYIDQITPQIVNVVRQNPTNEFLSTDQVTFRVQFNEALDATSFGAEDFILKGTAAGSGIVGAPVMVDSRNYDYTVTGIGNNSGTIGLQYNGALTDQVTQNPLAITNYTEQLYTLVNPVPVFETTTPTTNVSQGDTYNYPIGVASNLNGAGYKISVSNLPDWLTLVTGDTITTIAGTGSSGNEGNGGPALDASFGPFLRDVEYDHEGNLYIVDRNNHLIRKVSTDGTISLFAGAGTAGFSGDGASGTAATFNFPSSITFDQNGNAYIADDFNYRIRKVDNMGVVSTVAGTGSSGFSGDLGFATAAEITQPLGVVVGPDNNLYIAEVLRIRKVDLGTGIISTVAGNGTGTFVDNVTATNSGFFINAIDIDTLGSLYVASASHAVRKIDAITGLTSTIAGTGTSGFSGDGTAATSALLNNPNAIALDAEGTVFIAERENDRIRVIDQGGIIRTLGGNGVLGFSGDGGAANAAAILNPEGLAIDDEGRVIFSDAGNLRIRSIQTNKARLSGTAIQSAVGNNTISITATNGQESVTQDFVLEVVNVNDAPGLSPQLNATTSATEDASYSYLTYANDIDGDFVDIEVTTIPDWLTAESTLQDFTFTSGINATDIAYANDFFYITDQANHSIYQVSKLGGAATRIAGQTDNSSGFTDGNGTAAAFETPFAIDADSNGDLYVIDQDNHALRKITDVEGVVTVTTIAGNGSAGDATGAVSAATATFDSPLNLLVAPNDDIYIADGGNGVIKKLSGGNLTTLQDGSGSDFTFAFPYGLALDNAGVLYVSDFGSNQIYSIDGTTRNLLAGSSSSAGSTDGDGSVALFNEPAGIVTNDDGSVLFIAESGNELIRRLDIEGGVVTVSTVSDAPSTPIGMIRNPFTGALLVADAGFSAVIESYHAIEVSGFPENEDVGNNPMTLSLNDGTAVFENEIAFYVSNTNDGPSFTGTAPTTTTEDEVFSYTITSEDIDNDAIAFEASTVPDWLTLSRPEPIVSTVAGNGVDEFSGDDGAATDAGIGTPEALALDAEGNMFIAHENYIRKVDTDGNITTVVGDGTAANTGDGGPGIDAQVTGINDIHFGPNGSLYISINGAIRELRADGMIQTIAGGEGMTGSAGTGDGGAAVSATFNQNTGIFVDRDGNVFVADGADDVIRKIETDGNISTVATAVTFPFDVVTDLQGNIYAVNDGSTGLLKIDENDVKTDLTTASDIHFSTISIDIDNVGNIYGVTSNSPANQIKVYSITSNEVSIIANDANSPGFSGDDGVASTATFNILDAIAVGPNGNVFVADRNNRRIRKLTIQDPVLSGTPTQDDLGNHAIVLGLADGLLTDQQSFNLTVNNLPEILNVTSTDGNYVEGDVLDIVVTFDGDVTSSGTGTAPAIELETGDTDQTIAQSANTGTGITFSYTVQSGDSSPDLAYNSTAIAIGDYTIQSPEGVDAVLTLPTSGSSGSLSANQNIIVDTEIPTLSSVSIASDNATTSLAREGDEVTLSLTSSEGLTADPTVIIAGNTATVTGLSSTSFEATYTMTADDEEGEVSFTINFTDDAGNAGSEVTTTTDESAVTYDNTSPSVVLSTTIGEATNEANFELTMTFSTSVTGFTVEDLTLINATASDFSGSNDVYSVTISPIEEGYVMVAIAADVAQDAAGNLNVAATTYETSYDITVPTVSLSSSAVSVNDAFELSITFSESVTDFEASDLSITNASASNFSGSGTTYTSTVTPESEGEVTLNIAAGVANDAAENVNTAATGLSVDYDVTGPRPTLATSANSTNSAFEVSITFDESVTGFTVDDLSLTNASASNFSGSGTTYAATITPESEGEVKLNIAAEVANDAAGNANSAATELSVDYDLTDPTPTLATATNSTNSAFEISITFDESVTGFTVDDLSLANAVASNFSGSGTTYAATLTPEAEGEVTLNIAAEVANDAAGNANSAATELSVDYDLTGPAPTLATSANSTNSAFEISITFDESVTGFTVDDLSLTNASASNFSGSGTTYAATITPEAEGEVTLNIAAEVANDAAGNANTAATELSVDYDVTSPTPTLATESTNTNSAFDVSITFDESVTGFAIDDLALTNATASEFDGSGTSYTVTVTPDEDGEVTISIPAEVATDAAENLSTASNTLSITHDTTSPTVILSSESSGTVTGAFQMEATFSESVSGFTSDDITVSNGTLSEFDGSGSSYSFTITPIEEGDVTVSIAAGVSVDATGNSNTAATVFSINFVVNDTESPSVTITSEVTTTSGAFEISITFSEAVIDFVTSDITVINGSVGSLSGSGSEYTATVTPIAVGEVELSIAAGVTEDAAGNSNTASNTISVTFDGTEDTTAPSVTLTTETNTVSESFEVNIVFSEEVSGFEIGDIAVDNGTAAGLTGSGSAYTVSITPIAAGTVTIVVAASVAEDAAGNANTASNSLAVTFDGTEDTSSPTVSITTAATEVTEAFEISISFNEEVVGFESTDLSIENGTLSDFSGSGSSYTATITPIATGTVSISIEAGVAEDAAGNGNTSGLLAIEATISETTLSSGFSAEEIKIYPNPGTDFIHIDSSEPVLTYQVFDMKGKVVLEAGSETQWIDVRILSDGTYLLKINTNEGVFSKVILKK